MSDKIFKLKVISDASCSLLYNVAVISYCILDADDNIILSGYEDVDPEKDLTILEGKALLLGLGLAIREIGKRSRYRISCLTDSQNLVQKLQNGVTGREQRRLRVVVLKLLNYLKDNSIRVYHVSKHETQLAHDIAQQRLNEQISWRSK